MDGAQPLGEEFDGPRACGPYELAPALDLINYVFRVERNPRGDLSQPQHLAMGWENSHVYAPGNLNNVRIVRHHPSGRVVASVGIFATRVRTPRGEIGVGGISAVATDPAFRRHGLSSAALLDAAAAMRAAGLHAGLLGTGIPHFYRRLGWERAGCQRIFTLDRANVALFPDSDATRLEVTQDWRRHVAALAALHHQAPLGAQRTPAMFALLAERRADAVYVALRSGRPVAYLALRHGAVHEYGGANADVVQLLRAVFEALDDPSLSTTQRRADQRHAVELSVYTPEPGISGAEDLAAVIANLGLPCRLTYQGMMTILDPPGLFRALGLDGFQVAPHQGGWRVVAGERETSLTLHQLVKLVFGPEHILGADQERFPVPFYQWPLERV